MKKNQDTEFHHEIVSTDQHLPLRLFFSNDGPSYVPPHFHEDIEIIFLLTGELTVNLNQKKCTIFPGDAVLFNSNAVHSTLSETADTTAYVLQFPIKILAQCVPSPELYLFEFPMPSKGNLKTESELALRHLQRLLADGYTLLKEQPDFYQAKMMSFLYEIIYILCRFFALPSRDAHPVNDYKYYSRLLTITSYINQHYTEPVSLNTLAELICVTPAYLSRFFKKALQTTFTEYITSIRLEHAYTDLLTTEYPVQYISEKNGFANYAMFSRKFKDTYHDTPMKIRKSRRQSQ